MKTGETGPSGTVILAAGEFPKRGGAAWRLVAGAGRVVCCDGAADAYRRRFHREPDLVVGDCDSLRGVFSNVVRVDEQETNDLEKAARLCAWRGWQRPIVVGATGRREDHSIGNVFRALDLGLEIVTDYGRFIPVSGRAEIATDPGAAVSVFAPTPGTRVTSKGLKWPLDGIVFDSLYRATLNRALGSRVELESTKPVSVFVAEGGAL